MDAEPERAGASSGWVEPLPSSPPPPPSFPPPPPLAATAGRSPVGPPAGTVRSLRQPALAAQVCMGAASVAMLFSAWTSWVRRSDLAGVRDDGDPLSPARADELDRLVGVGALVSLAAILIGAGFFIWWFHRAYCNLASTRNTERSTKWAIWAWFVPIMNLFRPAQIANEIATHSPSPSLNVPPRIVSTWWAFWVLGNVLNRFVIRFDLDTLNGLIRSDTVSAGCDLLLAVAAVLAIFVIRNISDAQRTRFGLHAA